MITLSELEAIVLTSDNIPLYGVLISLIALNVTLFAFFFTVLQYLNECNREKKRKLLECVYNPLKRATYIFQEDFKEDKTNIKQQFEIFNIACLDVTQKYKYLIYQDTNQCVHQLYKAKQILDGTNTEENLGNLGGSISALHAHLDIKIKEINKKSLLRFFIIYIHRKIIISTY